MLVEEKVKAKVERARKRNRALWIGVPAAVIVGLLVWRPWSSDSASDTTVAVDTAATASTVPPTTAVPNTISKALSTKPVVEIPAGAPPKELVVKDLVVGTGLEAVAGSNVKVQYVGVSYSTKKQFDASWDRGGTPFDVENLGQAPVIQGWNEGLIGAKKGGRRELIIPAEKGYGEQGQGADIKPGETLVFVIDVLDVQPPAGAATTTALTAATTTPAATTPGTTSAARATATPTTVTAKASGAPPTT